MIAMREKPVPKVLLSLQLLLNLFKLLPDLRRVLVVAAHLMFRESRSDFGRNVTLMCGHGTSSESDELIVERIGLIANPFDDRRGKLGSIDLHVCCKGIEDR